ncbi:MAG: glucans biosynthesis glucosyltransferase MdoH [Acetobacter sp.]|nr:glucans biosynthesis glucosyltransferase MdoH [Acetobacter sp.]
MVVPVDTIIKQKFSDSMFFPALPPEAPLDMPVQDLRTPPDMKGREGNKPVTSPHSIVLRRVAVIGSALLMTIYGAWCTHKVMDESGVSTLGIIILLLFSVLFMWIALAFTSAVAGFCSFITHGGRGLGIQCFGALPHLRNKTALLLPTYNEVPYRVMAGVQTIYTSLEQTGQLESFDLFILSDTTDPDIWVQEEAAFLELREKTGGHNRIFYRRRYKNIERKAGNIGEWIRRFGAAYECMVILDADSIMSGSTLVRLADAMARNPGVGLIQTLPMIVGGTTLFARLQQFAGRIYGPVIAFGIAWWHGSEGNYWGHNAIIRTRAFADQAGLPHIPGQPPFGGHILSHDFVEAALMRRGGWAIHMIPALDGSYEESPPTLTDIAIRDRRWCQGNLQHMRVLPTRKLHWVSRLHMIVGIGAYVTSPLWLIFCLVGVCISIQAYFYHPEYFGTTKLLYPNWPHVDPVQARNVFIGTMVVLLAPKLLAYIAMLCDHKVRNECGGTWRLGVSVFLETLIGGLIAPISMLIQTLDILSILRGHDSGWNVQRRDDGRTPLRDVIRNYWFFTVFGTVLGIGAWIVSPALFFWMTPILLGLMFSIPLVALTSSRIIGQQFRRSGLLLIPEETKPPVVLDILKRIQHDQNMHEIANKEPYEAMRALRADIALQQAHLAMIPPERKIGDPIDVEQLVGLLKLSESPTLEAAERNLTAKEKAAVLATRKGVKMILDLPAI